MTTITFTPGGSIALGASTPLSVDVLQAVTTNGDLTIKANGSGLVKFVNTTDTTKELKIDPQGTTGTYTTISTAQTANQTVTIPNVGASSFVMTEGSQTINGAKTFGTNVVINGNLNVLGTTTTTSSATLSVANNIIIANAGPSGTKNAGLLTQRYQTENDTALGDVVSDTADATGTTQAGSGTSVTLANAASSSDDTYIGYYIKITSGGAANEVRKITAYVGATRVATINTAWTVNPGAGATYSLYGGAYTGILFDETAKKHTIVYTSRSDVSAPSIVRYSDVQSATASLKNTTNQLIMGSTTTTTINATAPAADAVYTIPDVGTTANFIMSAGTQTIAGSKTLSSAVTITPVTNQIVMGTTNTTTINATAPAASRVYTIGDAGTNASFVMTEGSQTINGTKTFSAATPFSSDITVSGTTFCNTLKYTGSSAIQTDVSVNATGNVIADIASSGLSAASYFQVRYAAGTSVMKVDAGGNLQVRAVSSNPSAGLTLTISADTSIILSGTLVTSNAQVSAPTLAGRNTTNQVVLGTTNTTTISATAPSASRIYTMPDVGNDANFIMSQGTQTIAGSKTFSSGVTISPTTNQLILGVTNTTTINATAPAASRVYTIPDVSADASFVMTQGSQTISGTKTFANGTTFSSAITVTPTTNQLVLGVTNTTTINATAPAASRTYTIPDVLTDANFVMSAGTQTINGTKTFGSATTFNGAITIVPTTNQIVLGNATTTTLSATAPASNITYTIPDSRLACNVLLQALNSGLTNASTRPAISGGSALSGASEIRGYSSSSLTADDGFLRLRAGGGSAANVTSYIDLSGFSTQPDMDRVILFGTAGTEAGRFQSDQSFKLIAGAYFPTSGGTAALLNYWEDNVTVSGTYSGPWTASVSLFFSKHGRMVFVNFLDNVATSSSASKLTSSAGVVPSRFRPAAAKNMIAAGVSGGSDGHVWITVSSAGTVTVAAANNSVFSGSGNAGFYGGTVSYYV